MTFAASPYFAPESAMHAASANWRRFEKNEKMKRIKMLISSRTCPRGWLRRSSFIAAHGQCCFWPYPFELDANPEVNTQVEYASDLLDYARINVINKTFAPDESFCS